MPDAIYDYQLIQSLRDQGKSWKHIRDEHYPDTTPKNLQCCWTQHKQKRGREHKNAPPASSLPREGSIQIDEKGGVRVTTVLVRNKPKTDKELAELFDVDPDVWYPDQIKTGHWNGWAVIDDYPTIADLYNIKVTWRRREGISLGKDIIEAVLARRKVKPSSPAILKASEPGILGLNVPDLHLGKLCWPRETGGDYDLGIACRTFADCVRDLAAKHLASKKKTGTVLVPIGNDFLNSDGPVGGKGAFTTAGTQQDEDGRWQKSFELGLFGIIDEIEGLKKMFPKARIIIKVVPGNHDETRIFYLGVALRVHFRNDKRVYVDNNPTTRKFYDGLKHAGVPVALMLTHGHREKLQSYPALMAHHFDLRQYAAKEVWTGHLHHQRGISFDTYTEIEQLLCRQFPSLSPADAWHAGEGYILSMRCAQSIYFDHQGRVGNIEHHHPEL